MPGAVQMSDNVGIHEKETLDEEEQEKQAVKAKVEKAIGESFDDDDWEYVDASECHVGSLDRELLECFRWNAIEMETRCMCCIIQIRVCTSILMMYAIQRMAVRPGAISICMEWRVALCIL